MRRKILLAIFGVICLVIYIMITLISKRALVVHPQGIIAESELELIKTNILLMLSIIVPTFILLFVIVWKYCIKSNVSNYDPDHHYGFWGQLVMWTLPSLVVAVMAMITWKATHQLNPYKPLDSEHQPLVVQVIALDWKWLFIYPEQGITSLNTLYLPEKRPIHFKLTADGAPMNSFWIPQLSGQIYSMAGMTTQLFIMANKGEYVGREAEINGEGYADMHFSVKATSRQEFDEWIEQVQKSTLHLTKETYLRLAKPFVEKSVMLFSNVEKDLFQIVIDQYMYPKEPVL
jgi:cytochrome o ubiquinol oxidase subunit II